VSRPRHLLVAALLAFTALALSGCGLGSGSGGGGNAAADSTPTATPTPTLPVPTPDPGVPAVSAEQIKGALLEAAAIGSGFAITDDDGGSSSDRPDQTSNQRCTELFHSELDTSVVPVREAERAFAPSGEGSDSGSRVIQNIANFASIAHATSAVQQLAPLGRECTTWSEGGGATALTYTVVPPKLPSYGDESSALGIIMAGNGVTFQVRFVLMRVGNNACMLVVVSPGELRDEDVAPVAGAALEKLRALPHA
jgi:hypothetical protein